MMELRQKIRILALAGLAIGAGVALVATAIHRREAGSSEREHVIDEPQTPQSHESSMLARQDAASQLSSREPMGIPALDSGKVLVKCVDQHGELPRAGLESIPVTVVRTTPSDGIETQVLSAAPDGHLTVDTRGVIAIGVRLPGYVGAVVRDEALQVDAEDGVIVLRLERLGELLFAIKTEEWGGEGRCGGRSNLR